MKNQAAEEVKESADRPSEGDRDDSGAVLSNLEEGRLGEVEVLEGRVAPAAIVIGQSEVWRAEVGGGDGDGAREAPSGVVVAPHFETSSAAQPIVEQRRAQRRRVRSVPLAV